jgi:cell shape-determining protein MreD
MRPLIYIALGWLLLAAVGGLGHTLGLTIMLPATSAALVAHVVFGRDLSLPAGLFVAVALGYLEDLHQGTPVGLLSLAYGLACCALVWSSRRLAVEGPVARALAAGVTAALIDLITFALLFAVRRRLGVEGGALVAGLIQARWHALATVLAAPAVFHLADLALRAWGRSFGRRLRPSRRSPLQARAAALNASDQSNWT